MTKQFIRYRYRLAIAKTQIEVELLAMGIERAGLSLALFLDLANARRRVGA